MIDLPTSEATVEDMSCCSSMSIRRNKISQEHLQLQGQFGPLNHASLDGQSREFSLKAVMELISMESHRATS